MAISVDIDGERVGVAKQREDARRAPLVAAPPVCGDLTGAPGVESFTRGGPVGDRMAEA